MDARGTHRLADQAVQLAGRWRELRDAKHGIVLEGIQGTLGCGGCAHVNDRAWLFAADGGLQSCVRALNTTTRGEPRLVSLQQRFVSSLMGFFFLSGVVESRSSALDCCVCYRILGNNEKVMFLLLR